MHPQQDTNKLIKRISEASKVLVKHQIVPIHKQLRP